MEYCNGDLYNKLKLKPTRRFEEDEAFLYFAQLVNGRSDTVLELKQTEPLSLPQPVSHPLKDYIIYTQEAILIAT